MRPPDGCTGGVFVFTHPVVVSPFGIYTYGYTDGATPDWTAPVTPFTMTGSRGVLDPRTDNVVQFDLTGQGTFSTAWVDVGCDGCAEREFFLTVHYTFAPVPKPATLMLLVTGVAAVGWRYRGRGRR